MGGNVGEDGSGGGSEGGRQWAPGKRRERMTVLAVEGWGEAVVEVKKVGRGERRMEGVVSLQGRVVYYLKSLLN